MLAVACTSLSAVSLAQAVGLQNATASFSQTFSGTWNVSEAIDGVKGITDNGWAVSTGSATNAETAVFETINNVTANGLQVTFVHDYASLGGTHLLGRYRVSVTSDDRSEFADGLQSGGDITANWTVLTPTSVSAGAMGSTILGDGSILMSNVVALTDYVVTFDTPVTNITGIRIEAMEDASLPTGGPGMYSNGNFVLTELEVEAVPEPATMSVLALAALGFLRKKNKN